MAQETGKSSASISPSKQLGSCLKLLKGGTDEEVFAGLLMLTKHVKPAEFKRFRLKVLEEMQGPLFLSRVIKSGLKGDSNADLYLTIGLSVASTFCQDPTCANRLKSLFPLFEEVAMEERINNEVLELVMFLYFISQLMIYVVYDLVRKSAVSVIKL